MSDFQSITTSTAVLGAVLARLRIAKGLKQSDIATSLGIAPSGWSRIEKGETYPSLSQLKAAARMLGETPGRIMDLAEEAESELISKGMKIDDTTWANVFGGSASTRSAAIGLVAGGMAAGSFIPVVGTALGGLIGGLIGTYLNKQNKE